jgi:tetratricopeptide (TPR) repeat protein
MKEWQTIAKDAADMLNSSKPSQGKSKAECDACLQRAVDLFWQAAKLRPDFSRGYLGLARALRQLGEIHEAREALLHGLQRCPDDGALLQELAKLDKLLNSNDSGYPCAAEFAAADDSAPASVTLPTSIDEAAILLRTQSISADVIAEMKNTHGANLAGLGKRAEQWISQLGPSGGAIVDRLRHDAAGDEETYYIWCLCAKQEIDQVVPQVAEQRTLSDQWKPRVKSPRLVMLVGLPGCGKSTLSEALVQSKQGWIRLCQDELEGRKAFEDAIGRSIKDKSKRLVLDRTNVVRADRKYFLELAFNPKDAVCVHFDVSADVCEERVAKRTDHPTIKYGGGRGAVRSMRDAFEKPLCEEGFSEVITLQTFADVAHLLECWGVSAPTVAPSGFFKFPTTPHILDLTHGKALTESDRLLTPAEAAVFYDGKTVVIAEEKFDGANLGISLTENYEPRYQNRSHYVSSGYATQWKALDRWWDDNGWAICQLLEPEVEVLFGEWLWARQRCLL